VHDSVLMQDTCWVNRKSFESVKLDHQMFCQNWNI